VLRSTLALCTERGFVVTETNVEQVGEPRPELTKLTLAVSGSGSVPELVGELMEVPGVLSVNGRAASGGRDGD